MANWSHCYYRSKLPAGDQQIYDAIYNGWNAKNKNIRLMGGISRTSLTRAVTAVAEDHPEIFWVDYYSYRAAYSILFTELRFDFFFTDREITYWQGEAKAWQERTAGKVPPNFVGKDLIWLLYDYLARQVTYGEQSTAYSHTIIGPLSKSNHVSVCEGIAKSLKFLCDRVGIPCIVVTGDAFFGPGNRGPHAWNIVEYNGIYRHLDVTNEISTAHFFGKANRNSFLHTDAEMTKYKWNTLLTPPCN